MHVANEYFLLSLCFLKCATDTGRNDNGGTTAVDSVHT